MFSFLKKQAQTAQTNLNSLATTAITENTVAIVLTESINHLDLARELKAIAQEGETIIRQRQARLNILNSIFANDTFVRNGLDTISAMEAHLLTLAPDSTDAVAIQTQKSMTALYYGLPVHFIQSDAAANNLIQLNLSKAQLIRQILQLPADHVLAKAYMTQITEINQLKTMVIAEMALADKALVTLCALEQAEQQAMIHEAQ